MKKYLNLVEARVRDAEDILTQMPPGGQGPSPRVLKRLEDAEEALKAQYKRMNDTLEAVADKFEEDIEPIPMDEPKSKTTALLKNSTQERPYGPYAKDPETIPESDEPKFKPGAKVMIQNPKTKHWDRSAIVINWRHGRTYVLDDGTQRFTRKARWSNERRYKNHFITDTNAPNADHCPQGWNPKSHEKGSTAGRETSQQLLPTQEEK